MPELEISAEARRYMKDIQTYIAEELESPMAAFNTVSGIVEKIRSLLQFPEKGTLLVSNIHIAKRYRYLRFKNYLIFYRCEKEKILIIRVIYAKRDYVKILFPEIQSESSSDLGKK